VIGGRATRAIAMRGMVRTNGLLPAFAGVCAACAAFIPNLNLAVLAGACGTAAAAVSCLRGAQREETTNLRYLAAPLYGREVARALAIAPCVAIVLYALAAAAIAAVALASFDGAPSGDVARRLLVVLMALVIAVLVALSAPFRIGKERVLYVGLAIIAGIAVEAVGMAASAFALIVAAIAAGIIAFFALRALGETLARYDPIDDV